MNIGPMNIGPIDIDPALKALAAALHGEGPAVELSVSDDGALVVGHVETPGCDDAVAVVRTSGSTGSAQSHGPDGRGAGGLIHGHRLRAQG